MACVLGELGQVTGSLCPVGLEGSWRTVDRGFISCSPDKRACLAEESVLDKASSEMF